ncbi:unnamed protein product [Eruca vesicaria subsp. sativa]|uniref:P-type H(+)-exporting transporter n=1 Tax=Eruca vesicaria subsp. sativa TaxID=29727 RepID=A0ABC8L5R1_ERUVS|nr:unnamed protein product [Eruca vesicaria subsp. sativa]
MVNCNDTDINQQVEGLVTPTPTGEVEAQAKKSKSSGKKRNKAPWAKLLSQYPQNPHRVMKGPVFTVGRQGYLDKEQLLVNAARASRVENQDAIDACIVGMLGDPREARVGITEVHFFPFNPVDKRTAINYIDANEKWHSVSKGAPEQIIELCNLREDTKKRAHDIIDKVSDRGLCSLAVGRQTVSEKEKNSPGEPWQFLGLLPLFDPPRHDSAETIRRALDLGVNVKMITGDQLAIGKETGRRLGMGTNMYPSSALLFATL